MRQWDRSGARRVETAGRGRHLLIIGVLALSTLLASCAGTRSPAGSSSGVGIGESAPDAPAARAAGRRGGGGYYLDDGPGDSPPPDLDAIADAVPRLEPVLARASRPYVVFGRQYQPMMELQPYRARGIATWYGRRYHGNRTSSGEPYDMYAMTAAHPTLPIPSYVRVTSVRNGRSVIVRVNDRGPFLSNRLIDLSYTAAAKLGYIGSGSAEVDVELITDFGTPPGTVLAAALGGEPTVSAVESAVSAGQTLALAVAPPAARPSSLAASALQPIALGAQEPAPQPITLAAVPTAQAGEAAEAPTERLTVETDIREQAAAVTSNEPASVAGVRPALVSVPAPPPAASSAALVPALDRAFWLQLGAFGSPDNARAARARLLRQGVGLGAPLDVVADGELYKLQAGPWPTRDAALAAGERVRAATELKPFAVRR